MTDEKIKINITETGQTIEVVVYSKKASQIEVVIGEGIHSTKCKLTPVDTGLGYVGNVMGREIVYERSRDQVQADIDNELPSTRRR